MQRRCASSSQGSMRSCCRAAATACVEVARGLEGRALVLQDVEGEPVIVLLLVEHPGLERFAIGHRKAGEEVCAQPLGQKLQAPPRSSGE